MAVKFFQSKFSMFLWATRFQFLIVSVRPFWPESRGLHLSSLHYNTRLSLGRIHLQATPPARAHAGACAPRKAGALEFHVRVSNSPPFYP
jgi:hypothetical protein